MMRSRLSSTLILILLTVVLAAPASGLTGDSEPSASLPVLDEIVQWFTDLAAGWESGQLKVDVDTTNKGPISPDPTSTSIQDTGHDIESEGDYAPAIDPNG